MATVASSDPKGSAGFPLKYLLWVFIGLMFAYVLVNNEAFVLDSKHPAWAHYEPFKWSLLPHALA